MTDSKSKAPLPVLIQPGPRNSLADVVGLFVGNAVDLNALTGVTVAVLPDRPLLAPSMCVAAFLAPITLMPSAAVG